MQDPSFISNLKNALDEITMVNIQAVNLFTSIPEFLRKIHPYAFATLLILFIALIFMCIGFIFSNVIQCCVIKTQDRKLKVLSNVSWCTSSISLIMIFTAGLALSFGGPVLSDFCRIQEL